MHETMLLVQMAALLLAVGAFAGLLAGLLGVGGGLILVPAFFFVFERLGYASDQLMQMCLGTSLATIIVTSTRAGLAHHARGAVDLQILRHWAPGIVAGAALGVLAVSALRTPALQLIFGVMALCVAFYLGFGREQWRLGTQMPGGAARAVLSPGVGFLSVLLGIGGGSFGVPLMTLYGVPMHRAVATAAGFGVLIAVPSALGFLLVTIDPAIRPPYTLGAVNLLACAIVIAMTLLTAPLGARLAQGMEARALRRIFAVFLVLVALNMLRKVVTG